MNKNELLEANPELTKLYSKHPPKYGPNPNCEFCKGTGVKHIKKLKKYRFCICTIVNHDCSSEVGKMLGKHAKKMLKENPFTKH